MQSGRIVAIKKIHLGNAKEVGISPLYFCSSSSELTGYLHARYHTWKDYGSLIRGVGCEGDQHDSPAGDQASP